MEVKRSGMKAWRVKKSPIGGLVVLEKFSPEMDSRIFASNDRVHNPRRAVYDVEWWMEAMFLDFSGGDLDGVFVGHPSGIDAVHVDAVGVVVGGGGPSHHIERSLGHIGVWVASCFEFSVELTFHGGDIDDVLIAFRGAKEEGFESGVDQKRGDGVDELDLE